MEMLLREGLEACVLHSRVTIHDLRCVRFRSLNTSCIHVLFSISSSGGRIRENRECRAISRIQYSVDLSVRLISLQIS